MIVVIIFFCVFVIVVVCSTIWDRVATAGGQDFCAGPDGLKEVCVFNTNIIIIIINVQLH